jgi:hypothetical protein
MFQKQLSRKKWIQWSKRSFEASKEASFGSEAFTEENPRMIQKKLSRKRFSQWFRRSLRGENFRIIQKKLLRKKISEWLERSFQERKYLNESKLSRKKIFAWSKRSFQRRKSCDDPTNAYKQENMRTKMKMIPIIVLKISRKMNPMQRRKNPAMMFMMFPY